MYLLLSTEILEEIQRVEYMLTLMVHRTWVLFEQSARGSKDRRQERYCASSSQTSRQMPAPVATAATLLYGDRTPYLFNRQV